MDQRAKRSLIKATKGRRLYDWVSENYGFLSKADMGEILLEIGSSIDEGKGRISIAEGLEENIVPERR